MAANSFKAVMEGYFRRNGGWPRLKGELAVYYWPRVAGREIAIKVEAKRFYDGYLYLQTDNAALAHQLSLLNLDIVKKYRQMLGPNIIKGVKIKIGPIGIKKDNQKPNGPEIELNQEETGFIEKCGQLIAKPELTAQFTKVMKKHYTVKRRIETNGGQKCRACGIIIEPDFDYCPCCERQVNEENRAYLTFIKKTTEFQN